MTSDLAVARDFDLGLTGPPLAISMDFIASGLVELIGGLASALVLAAYAWWAAVLLAGAWIATHWLLRESGVWHDRNTDTVRSAQREADYAYRLAVDPPASKELRLFGLAGWTIERFVARRTRLHDLQYAATRLREQPMTWSLLVVLTANVLVFWSLARAASAGSLGLGAAVVFAQSAVGTSMIAFGGLNWALDSAAAPVSAVLRLEATMAVAGALPSGRRRQRQVTPASPRPRFDSAQRQLHAPRNPPTSSAALRCWNTSTLTIPAGSSLAIVGQNGAGKTTLAKLLCRLYDPQSGTIEVDGIDLRELDLDEWRSRITAVFQDFIRLELPLRDNVAPAGAPDDVVRTALQRAGGANLATIDTVLRRSGATTAERSSQAVNGSASRSRGHCVRSRSGPASCCWTNRRRSSTSAAKPRSSSACCPPRASAPRSSSPIVSRRSARPTASACSSTVELSNWARTTN